MARSSGPSRAAGVGCGFGDEGAAWRSPRDSGDASAAPLGDGPTGPAMRACKAVSAGKATIGCSVARIVRQATGSSIRPGSPEGARGARHEAAARRHDTRSRDHLIKAHPAPGPRVPTVENRNLVACSRTVSLMVRGCTTDSGSTRPSATAHPNNRWRAHRVHQNKGRSALPQDGRLLPPGHDPPHAQPGRKPLIRDPNFPERL